LAWVARLGLATVLAVDCLQIPVVQAQRTAPDGASDAAQVPLARRMFDHSLVLLQRNEVKKARELLEVAADDGYGDAAHLMALTFHSEALLSHGLSNDWADESAYRRWAQRASALQSPVSDPRATTVWPIERPFATASTAIIGTSPPPVGAREAAPPAPSSVSAAVPGPSPVTIADGTYSTHVPAACGEPFQSVMLTIATGVVTFEHVLQGVPYGWRGTIDKDGNIRAAVGGSQTVRAEGRFDQKSIDLFYPQCGTAPIAMRIRWLVR
jgi:hypothetical protein